MVTDGKDKRIQTVLEKESYPEKKGVSRRVYGMDWYQGTDGKYSKGHIGCGCGLCKPGKRFRRPSWEDERKTAERRRDIEEYWNNGSSY